MTTLPGVGLGTPFGWPVAVRLFELFAPCTGSGLVTTPSETLGGSGVVALCAKAPDAKPDKDVATVVQANNVLRISHSLWLCQEVNEQPHSPFGQGCWFRRTLQRCSELQILSRRYGPASVGKNFGMSQSWS
jgi:hypothetical protein